MTFTKIPVRKTIVASVISTSLCLSSPTVLAAEKDTDSIADAFKQGDAHISFRLRYEDVAQDVAGGTNEASALTLRTRLNFSTASFNGFGLSVEMDDTTEVIETDKDTIAGTTAAAIADPEVTEVNQAYISYTTGSTTAKWGRQRILLDNQRFVGGVGWRQDEQTYSGFTVSSKPMDGLSLFYGYITEVNRIFAEAQDHNHDTHLLNAKYDTPLGSLIGYGYLIDNQTALALGSDTFGLRWQGKIGQAFHYNLEYASQSEGGDNPSKYKVDYMLAEVKGDIATGASPVNLKAGYEVLGSDEGNKGFTTSLATLHAFQGWADKFLGTPDAGVVDTYVGAGTKLGKIKFDLTYHSLSADYGSTDYGSEIDFVASTKVGPVGLVVKYAHYSADAPESDTSKLWLMAAVAF